MGEMGDGGDGSCFFVLFFCTQKKKRERERERKKGLFWRYLLHSGKEERNLENARMWLWTRVTLFIYFFDRDFYMV